jgi:hypothetical protein
MYQYLLKDKMMKSEIHILDEIGFWGEGRDCPKLLKT